MTKKTIIAFIKSKGIQLEPEDYYLVEEFRYNQHLMKLAKKEVQQLGILVNVSTKLGVESMQKNQAIAVYDKCLANMADISKRLGLSPSDRKALINETPTKPGDGFDD